MMPSLPELAGMVERLAPVVLDAGARSVVVLGLAGVAAAALRRGSAAARHWVWMLGVGGLLLLPGLSASVPGWRVLPRVVGGQAAPVVLVNVTAPFAPAIEAPVRDLTVGSGTPADAGSEAASAGAQDVGPARAAAPLQAAGAVEAAAVTPTADGAAAMQRPAAGRGLGLGALPWTFWLVLVWLLGSLLVAGHVVLGFLSLWSLQRRCGRLNQGDWPDLLAQLRQLLKVRRPVELLSSPERTMPMTWGLRRTRLLVPAQAANWPPEQRRAVLLHELGHARRWDCVTQLVAQIACAMYWFNPLVWVAWRRIQVERERACDDLVLNTGARASAYAEHLLHSASAMPVLRFVGAAVAMARPSTLEERMRAILDPRRDRRALSLGAALATIALLVALLVPVAALQAQASPARGAAPAAFSPGPPPGYPADGSVPLPPGYSAQTAPARGAAAGGSGSATGPAATAPAARGGGRGVGGGSTPVPGSGATCTLDATIYDVRLPLDKIGQLDIEALTRVSGTAAGFEKALGDLGAAKPLYRANQSIRLAGDTITIGTSVPYITNSQVSGFGGREANTVSYSQTGASFAVAGKAGAGGSIELDMTVQVSAMSDGVAISDNVKAPIFRTATLARKGPVEARQPFVVLSVDGASLDADGKAVAYVARVTLGAPQSGN